MTNRVQIADCGSVQSSLVRQYLLAAVVFLVLVIMALRLSRGVVENRVIEVDSSDDRRAACVVCAECRAGTVGDISGMVAGMVRGCFRSDLCAG